MKKLKKFIKHPRLIIGFLCSRDFLKWIPDKLYFKIMFQYRMGVKLNLKDPKTFNEKLQWLKLYDRNPEYTKLVDKYEVRKYIEKNIGEEYLIPLLGVWDKFEDIDFDSLPNQFVLKCTHDSGGVVICRDKNNLDIEKIKKKINKCLKTNYYYHGREWPYKNVKPKIICEQLIKTKDGKVPNDYKFYCFNGEPDSVMVCTERESGEPKFYFFDNKWNLLKYNVAGMNAPKDFTLSKPEKIDEMFQMAKKLSSRIPFVRVDLYYENGKIYFGELTFFPQSGYDFNLLEETDLLFGEKINLKEIEKKIKS